MNTLQENAAFKGKVAIVPGAGGDQGRNEVAQALAAARFYS